MKHLTEQERPPVDRLYGVPWFLTGFVVFFLIHQLHRRPRQRPDRLSHQHQFEVAALAAIGMRVKFADIIKEGPKPCCMA